MNPRVILLFSALGLFGSPEVLGAENQTNTGSSGAVLIFLFGPCLLLVVYLVILARKSGAMKQGGYMAKANEHMDRSVEHMARLEQRTDRIVELLESIDRRLGKGA